MRLTKPGETCWRQAQAHRLSFLIDGEAYFSALLSALTHARRSIHLLGWGFDPRVRLDGPDGPEGEVGRLLMALADKNPDLQVRLLIWRSALPISATQSFFPHRAAGLFKDSRVSFRLDSSVPFGACHHQKLVVIDESLAFVGGADLMPGRLDTPAHRDVEPARRSVGRDWPPRHEVMAMVDGPVAADLDTLFRDRWAAAGPQLAQPKRDPVDHWPAHVKPELTDTQVAIARTLPSWRGKAGVREIAALTLEAIFAAKKLIYIENQYFTWPLAVEALATRLAEPAGPEVVLVVSQHSPSYFDRITMDRARTNAIWRLRSSDVFGRFRPLAPYTADGQPIVVHAKLMVVDDALARVSSANLNNRSHGFDTECEVFVEGSDAASRAAVAAFRDRLAGHWVGRTAAEMARALASAGSLAQALQALDPGGRLRPLATRRLGPLGEFIADFHIGDPTDAGDSWRVERRRERLLADARILRKVRVRP